MVKVQEILDEAIELNKQDQRDRYIFYLDGSWQGSFHLPTLIDFNTFYVVNNGSINAVTF